MDKWKSTPEERARLAASIARYNRDPRMATRNSVQGRWVTPHPQLAASYPLDRYELDKEGIETVDAPIVNYVDVPNHVYEQIEGLKDQPTDVRHLSRMAEHEAVLPEEYVGKLTPSREHSSAKGLEILDNQDTYL
jgi:hypothetical protein